MLPDDLSCPLSVVKLFLTDEIVESIVEYTNEYANLIKQLPEVQTRMNDCDRSLFTLWGDLTVDELWVYFCLQIVMGLVHKPSIHSYWSQNHAISTPLFHGLMRRDRFEQIRKMIHFTILMELQLIVSILP